MDAYRKIISQQSQLLGQQSLIIEEHKCNNGWDEEEQNNVPEI